LRLAVRMIVIALVAVGVWYTVRKAMHNLEAQQFSWSDLARLRPLWLFASGLLYIAGLAPACWFWRQALRAMGQQPAPWPLVRAYFLGHLGKYVPGKAMVLVLRTGLIRGPGVDVTTAAVSVFVETLTLMAVGACLASALLAVFYREHTGLLVLGAAMTLGGGVPTLPPIFRRVVLTLQVKRINPHIEAALQGLDWRLTLWGWVSMSAGWCLMGLSLWAALQALPPGLAEAAPRSTHLPLLTATVALATVAGFVSFIPGGLGVRELVVIPLLAPVYGDVAAIVAAVLLRLIWLLAELATSGILYLPLPKAARLLRK
jgi:uncharacterized membrane protein YbhN (UPF0104 family)